MAPSFFHGRPRHTPSSNALHSSSRQPVLSALSLQLPRELLSRPDIIVSSVQRCAVRIPCSEVLAAGQARHSLGSDLEGVSAGGEGVGALLRHFGVSELLLRLARVREVDAGGRLRVVALGVEQARLEAHDVVSQGVVLGLEALVVEVHFVVVADLLFELFYVAFLPLAERPLLHEKDQ